MSKAGQRGSAVLVVLALVALCKPLFFSKPVSVQSRNRAEQSAFRRGLIEKKKAEIFIDSLLKAKGAVFLYTNDTLAKAGWVPNIAGSGINGVKSMAVEIINYEAFAAKYDSLGFTLLLNRNDDFFYPLNKVLVSGGATKCLYFMGYDSKGELLNDTAGLKAYPTMRRQNFVTVWGMGVNDNPKQTVDSLAGIRFLVCLELLKTVDGFFVYMAGAENDARHPGMDSAEFMQAVATVNKRLQKEGMDTSRFRVKIFRRP